MGRTVVCVKSYNRPQELTNLLYDIVEQVPSGSFVMVFDDGSDEDMGVPRRLCKEYGWTWVVATVNHGKMRAWEWHNVIYRKLREEVHYTAPGEDPLFYFFDDDMRLCKKFFQRSRAAWMSIGVKRRATLNFMVDSSRVDSSCWTGFTPVDASTSVRKTQWVDGSYMCDRNALAFLNWKLNRIPTGRWESAEGRSSGVGQQMSMRLHEGGFGLYQTKSSLVAHVSKKSKYNPAERARNPLITTNFIDGPEALEGLIEVAERARSVRGIRGETQKVTCSLASIPSRVRQLEMVVESMNPQVDAVQVYLNGYSHVPEFLKKAGALVCRSQDHGDRGDAGKFFWSEAASGYQMICDDDLVYPPDYVEKMIAALERHDLRAVVGLHGVNVHPKVVSYYQSRDCSHFAAALAADKNFHILGTGVLAYHPITISISTADFKEPNMADVWLGIAAQKQRVPMLSVKRAKGWVTAMKVPTSIYGSHRGRDAIQTAAIKAAQPWKIYK